ncbi:hypothetical protein C8J57DRAFT_1248207 [Mycena rebaudengoi]|nr:hypothetical protein C8J57DRAFT_1248207 [Mycena rebaudengoi]
MPDRTEMLPRASLGFLDLPAGALIHSKDQPRTKSGTSGGYTTRLMAHACWEARFSESSSKESDPQRRTVPDGSEMSPHATGSRTCQNLGSLLGILDLPAQCALQLPIDDIPALNFGQRRCVVDVKDQPRSRAAVADGFNRGERLARFSESGSEESDPQRHIPDRIEMTPHTSLGILAASQPA